MNQPPVVSTPPLWQLLQWISQPVQYLETNAQRYGDCFVGQLGRSRPYVFFSDPKAIEQLFTLNVFDSGKGNFVVRPTLGEQSLLILDGPRHHRHRQLLMPPFHGERMRAYGQLIGQLTEQVISQWSVGQPFVLRPYMQDISLQIILQAVFGLTSGPLCDRMRQRLGAVMDHMTSPMGFAMTFLPLLQRDWGAWSPGGRFVQLRQQADEQLYAEIRARRSQFDETRTDILSLLLMARDEQGQPMTDEELRDELMTLLLAGHETTATAVSWAMYWIHQHPAIAERLTAEVDSLGENPEPAEIVRLPYLQAVCSEALRLYPTVIIPSSRIAQQPVQILDYTFEAGTYLVPCIYLTHHRPDLYPDSHQFRPERFLERQFSPYEFLPFGGSTRRCIGAAFALYEMKLVIAAMLQRYRLKLAEESPIPPTRRSVTISPRGGVRMVVTEVRSQRSEPVPT